MVKKITPVLFVKEIEPVLPFWLDKLGFTKTIEVPDGNKLAFAAFKSGNAEIMYQTYASADHDHPPSPPTSAKAPPSSISKSKISTPSSSPSRAPKSISPNAPPSTAPRKSA